MQARAFLGRRAAGADRAELQQTLSELHSDIFMQIDQEVWTAAIVAMGKRTFALFNELLSCLGPNTSSLHSECMFTCRCAASGTSWKRLPTTASVLCCGA